MNITASAPSTPRAPRHNWSPLIDALNTAPIGEWSCVPLADLPGSSVTQKQINVHGAARRNNLVVQTRVEPPSLFVSRLSEKTN